MSIRSYVCASHACLPSYGRGHTLSIASIKAPYIEILSSILIHGCLQGLLFVSAFQSDTHMHEMEIVITGHVSPEYHLDQCVVFTIKQLMLCVSGCMNSLFIVYIRSVLWNIKIILTPSYSWCYQFLKL